MEETTPENIENNVKRQKEGIKNVKKQKENTNYLRNIFYYNLICNKI
jgi:hypothetical protein